MRTFIVAHLMLFVNTNYMIFGDFGRSFAGFLNVFVGSIRINRGAARTRLGRWRSGKCFRSFMAGRNVAWLREAFEWSVEECFMLPR